MSSSTGGGISSNGNIGGSNISNPSKVRGSTLGSNNSRLSTNEADEVREAEEVMVWRHHVNELRCSRNGLSQKMSFEQRYAEKSSQHFLIEDVLRYRVIYTTATVMDNEYVIVTVRRDMLLQNWMMRYYFPRNSRTLQCHIDLGDLFQASSRFLKQSISQ